MAKYKLRFNLGAGDNYKKWKITSPIGDARYVIPEDVTIVMSGCKLINQKGTATKIHEGANKTVCAWVECDSVVVYHKIKESDIIVGGSVCYNPKITPNWVHFEMNADKLQFSNLVTKDNMIYVLDIDKYVTVPIGIILK